jgi:hypothetical protein
LAIGLGAVVAAAATVIPLLGEIACCCCAMPAWPGVVLALLLARQLAPAFTLADGARVGFLTGLLAGLLRLGLAALGLQPDRTQFVELTIEELEKNPEFKSLPPEEMEKMRWAITTAGEFVKDYGAVSLALLLVASGVILGVVVGGLLRKLPPSGPAAYPGQMSYPYPYPPTSPWTGGQLGGSGDQGSAGQPPPPPPSPYGGPPAN